MSQSWLSYNFEVLNTKSNVSEQAGFCEKEFVNLSRLSIKYALLIRTRKWKCFENGKLLMKLV